MILELTTCTPRITAAPKRKRSIHVYIGGVSGNTRASAPGY